MKLFEIFGEIDVKNGGANLALDQTDQKAKGLGTSFGKLTKGSVALSAALAAAAAAAVAGITKVTKASIKAFDDQARAEKRLESIATTVTKATKEQIEALKELSLQYQEVTTFSDDLVIAGQSQLLSFGVNTDQAAKLTQSLVDLVAATKGAEATQEDFISAANLLGKAVNGEAGVLREAGILLNERQKLLLENGRETQRVAVLTQILNDNYGQLAQGLAETREGQMLQFKNALGGIGEQFAEVLMPALMGFTKFLKGPVLTILESMVKWFETNGPKIAKAFMPIFEGLAIAIKVVIDIMKTIMPIFKPIFQFLLDAVTGIGLIFGFVFKTITVALQPVIKVFEHFFAVIGNIFDFINNTFQKVAELMEKAFGPAVEIIQEIIEWVDDLLGKLGEVFDFFSELGKGAVQAFKDATDGIATPVPQEIQRQFRDEREMLDVIRGIPGASAQPTVTNEFAANSINVTIPANEISQIQDITDFFNRIPQLRRTVNV